jgi:hypothetical protein
MAIDQQIKEDIDAMRNDRNFMRLEGLLRQPNIFSILSIEGMEIRHSNFFAWLLDPNESHGLGDKVLREFLTKISGDEKAKLNINDEVSLEKVKIRREFLYEGESEGEDNDYGESKRKRSYIDILIIHDQFVVTVENKTGTENSKGQLERYWRAIEKLFPDITITKDFVYLTPDGDDPNDKNENEGWISYSYGSLVDLIDEILYKQEYGKSLNKKAYDYIKDYITIIRRKYMNYGESYDLADSVYKDHREALDFIFENKTNFLTVLDGYLEKKIKGTNWVPGSRDKTNTRFLTKDLNDIIPKGLGYTWAKKRESFAFELSLSSDKENITFKATINKHRKENIRVVEILSKAMKSLKGEEGYKEKIILEDAWIVYFSKTYSPFDVRKIEEVENPEDVFNAEINKYWEDIQKNVEMIEKAILPFRDELLKIKNE